MNNYRTYYKHGMCDHFESTAKLETLGFTHFPLMDVEAENLEDVYRIMQGEVWSPNGEARPLIEAAGLTHTSMSVGDVVENLATGKFYTVDGIGFSEMN